MQGTCHVGGAMYLQHEPITSITQTSLAPSMNGGTQQVYVREPKRLPWLGAYHLAG
jgi:hypothetical protein